MKWTTEQLAKLHSLQAIGLSASQIGAKIGKSRNAVIGKLHRMGTGPKGKWRPGPGMGFHQRGQFPARVMMPEDCFRPQGIDFDPGYDDFLQRKGLP
jgi:hypothetical protein